MSSPTKAPSSESPVTMRMLARSAPGSPAGAGASRRPSASSSARRRSTVARWRSATSIVGSAPALASSAPPATLSGRLIRWSRPAALGRVGEGGPCRSRQRDEVVRWPGPGRRHLSRAALPGRRGGSARQDRLAQAALDPRAAPGDLDAQPVAVSSTAQCTMTAGRRLLQGVGQQVGDDPEYLLLLQARRQAAAAPRRPGAGLQPATLAKALQAQRTRRAMSMLRAAC